VNKSIYLATVEPYSGKSLVSLGITELLLRKTSRVGVFRPVIGVASHEERDKNIDLLLTHYNLDLNYEDTYAFLRSEVGELMGRDRYDEIMDTIIEKYRAIEEKCDFILCIGSDLEGVGSMFEFDINADIAKNLGAPVLLVGTAAGRNTPTAVNTVTLTTDHYLELGSQVFGVIVNRADEKEVDTLKAALEKELGDKLSFISVIPTNKALGSPTMREVAQHLDASVLFGRDRLDRLMYDYLIIAMQLPNYLSHLTDNALLITPGDRADVILSALQAHQSDRYPQLAGILLSTEQKPPESVCKLLRGLDDLVPILSVEADTLETARQVSSVRSYLTNDNRAKIDLSLDLFEKYVDTDALSNKISQVKVRGLTPKMFIYNLVQQARSIKKHIVLPEGNDDRILTAAADLLKRDIVDLTIIGDRDQVYARSQKLGLQIDFDRTPVLRPSQSPQFEDYVQTFYELRKHRGVNLDVAHDLMRDVSYFGTMMVYKGDADGMVSGAVHTTMHTIRPALQFVKTKPGFSVVSSVFFMCLDDRVLVYGDCAVNPNPTAEQLAEIAIASADTAHTFGVDPKVAMLSYSSGESGQGEDVEKVRRATQIAQQRRPDLLLEGPMQYDAAVDPGVAAKKMPGSKVAGQATVFIFPDLNTGNNTYKAVQRETGAIAIGPVLQGLRKPVNDLSRGCTVEDVINTVVITAIQAQEA
jgi:phosphate acetyltransferase